MTRLTQKQETEETYEEEVIDEEDEEAMTMQSSNLLDQLKRGNSIKAEDEDSKSTINTALNMREFMKKNDI